MDVLSDKSWMLVHPDNEDTPKVDVADTGFNINIVLTSLSKR